MASITKRGKTFQVEVRKKGHPSVSKCFSTISEAKAWAHQQEALMNSAASPLRQVRERAIPTLSEALDRYRREVTPTKKSAQKEGSMLNFWATSAFASSRLCSISSAQISQRKEAMLVEGRTAATVTRYLALLSHIFTVARVDWGFALTNPVLDVRKPKVLNARSRRPTSEEMALILKHTGSTELRIFFQLAADTAMRRSELHSLRWEDLSLTKQFIYLTDTKNGSDRVVVISDRAVKWIERLGVKKEGKVFQFTHSDTPSKAFRRALKAAREQYVTDCTCAGIKPSQTFLANLRLHDLRHQATSVMFERGLTIPEVSSITGHKTLAMLSRYTHLRPESVLERLNKASTEEL
jgi:integrase